MYNEERGASQRAVVVVDKEGVIRFRQTYEPGVLPDPLDIVAAIEKMG